MKFAGEPSTGNLYTRFDEGRGGLAFRLAPSSTLLVSSTTSFCNPPGSPSAHLRRELEAQADYRSLRRDGPPYWRLQEASLGDSCLTQKSSISAVDIVEWVGTDRKVDKAWIHIKCVAYEEDTGSIP